ncbi:MAG: putative signal transducing protein [Bacillota bacterium]
MWTVVYIARNKSTAEYIKKVLEEEGVLVNIKPISITSHAQEQNFEVSVLEGEAEEAMEILNTALGTNQK